MQTFASAQEVKRRLVWDTDSEFRTNCAAPSGSSLPPYDSHFQQQWQNRWDFLCHIQKLSIQDIAAHPAVLQASLKDTLGPRWAFLSLEASHAVGFKLVDHLTAVSFLTDEEFALLYNSMGPGTVFDVAFIEQWQ